DGEPVIDHVAVSLSIIVAAPVAWAMISEPLLSTSCAVERTTLNASELSTMASSTTGMVMVAGVAPAGVGAGGFGAPLKSAPATALPSTVLKVTTVSSLMAADKVTVKLMLASVPSVAGFGVPFEMDTVASAVPLRVMVKFCCAESEPSDTVNVKFSAVVELSALMAVSSGTKVYAPVPVLT